MRHEKAAIIDFSDDAKVTRAVVARQMLKEAKVAEKKAKKRMITVRLDKATVVTGTPAMVKQIAKDYGITIDINPKTNKAKKQ